MREEIRNFVIIAHIDHGKSTLADRLLELTGTVEKRKMQEQYLDSMELERERGITIKMQPVRMLYDHDGTRYTLNLIDTPGHVDFSYEVSRALVAVEGAILLVDATKGVQAQTLSHLRVAVEQKLVIIPAINKIDLPHARTEEVEAEIFDVFASLNLMPETIHRLSAKTGEGVPELLHSVLRFVPAPKIKENEALRALVFDSLYDVYKGVVAHTRVFEGRVSAGERMLSMVSKEESEVKEVGIFLPEPTKRDYISAGNIGYIATGLKDISLVKIGDTITHADIKARAKEPLHGYREPMPVVFASFFPGGDKDYDDLKSALLQLKLNDAAFSFEQEYSEALGRGWKCGFLGMLHMEIVLERLRREYSLKIVVTSPSVVYKVRKKNGETLIVYTPPRFPDPSVIAEVEEPWAELEVIVPSEYLGGVLNLMQGLRGNQKSTNTIGKDVLRMIYEVPLSEIITDFYDRLKSVSSGYASLAYTLIGSRPAQLVKMDIMLAGEVEESLSMIVPKERLEAKARAMVDKIKKVIPSESFAISIQAAVGGKIIARETKSAYRKDVIAGLYGGDYTRKRKLLEKQKKGKKRMKAFGRVELDSDTFMKIFKSS